MKRIQGILAVALSCLWLSACGLPSADQKAAEALPALVDNALAYVAEREGAVLRTVQGNSDFLGVYAENEKWSNKFVEARAELNRARSVIETDVQGFLKRNSSKEAAALQATVANVEGIIGKAKVIARSPEQRIAFLEEARTNATSWITTTNNRSRESDTSVDAFRSVVETYQKNYPEREADIATRAGPVFSLHTQLVEAAKRVTAQALALKANALVDYAQLGDSYNTVVSLHARIAQARINVERELKGLDTSYSKILTDQKAEFKACVTRTSWYEGETEWPTETPFDYPCKAVSEDSYETAEEYDDRDTEIAVYSHGSFGGKKTRLRTVGDVTEADVQQLWGELALDPELRWTDGDNESTFDVRDLTATYFHRYLYIENGARREGDWEQVTPEFYEEHWDDLGMALVEKPTGQFENEANTVASPPGMNYVGNPHYGQWTNDSSGNTFWHYYGQYAFFSNLFGGQPSYYSRSDHEAWDRNRRAGDTYYGTTGSGAASQRWGTLGSNVQTSKLAQSTFAQRGGFREAQNEIRSAGPSARAGGPGGGGK